MLLKNADSLEQDAGVEPGVARDSSRTDETHRRGAEDAEVPQSPESGLCATWILLFDGSSLDVI